MPLIYKLVYQRHHEIILIPFVWGRRCSIRNGTDRMNGTGFILTSERMSTGDPHYCKNILTLISYWRRIITSL